MSLQARHSAHLQFDSEASLYEMTHEDLSLSFFSSVCLRPAAHSLLPRPYPPPAPSPLLQRHGLVLDPFSLAFFSRSTCGVPPAALLSSGNRPASACTSICIGPPSPSPIVADVGTRLVCGPCQRIKAIAFIRCSAASGEVDAGTTNLTYGIAGPVLRLRVQQFFHAGDRRVFTVKFHTDFQPTRADKLDVPRFLFRSLSSREASRGSCLPLSYPRSACGPRHPLHYPAPLLPLAPSPFSPRNSLAHIPSIPLA